MIYLKWIVNLMLLCRADCLLGAEAFFTPDQVVQMEELPNNTIKIRGFLYESGKGTWILAAQPNLTSCCLHSLDKINEKVLIRGDFSPGVGNQVAEFEGVLSKYFLYYGEGRQERFFELKKAVLLSKSNPAVPYKSFAVLMILILGLFCLHCYINQGQRFL